MLIATTNCDRFCFVNIFFNISRLHNCSHEIRVPNYVYYACIINISMLFVRQQSSCIWLGAENLMQIVILYHLYSKFGRLSVNCRSPNVIEMCRIVSSLRDWRPIEHSVIFECDIRFYTFQVVQNGHEKERKLLAIKLTSYKTHSRRHLFNECEHFRDCPEWRIHDKNRRICDMSYYYDE